MLGIYGENEPTTIMLNVLPDFQTSNYICKHITGNHFQRLKLFIFYPFIGYFSEFDTSNLLNISSTYGASNSGSSTDATTSTTSESMTSTANFSSSSLYQASYATSMASFISSSTATHGSSGKRLF